MGQCLCCCHHDKSHFESSPASSGECRPSISLRISLRPFSFTSRHGSHWDDVGTVTGRLGLDVSDKDVSAAFEGGRFVCEGGRFGQIQFL